MITDPKKLKAQENMDGTRAHIQEPFMDIKFQLGPVREFGKNGCQVEDVLEILIRRLKGFQQGPFPCAETIKAFNFLQAAHDVLQNRTDRRHKVGIEGTNREQPGV